MSINGCANLARKIINIRKIDPSKNSQLKEYT